MSLLTLFSRSITKDATNPVTLTVLFEQIDGTWQDISADVMRGTIKRGKQRELDKFKAGTCTLTLRNDSRQYDPNYASSPYNGSVLPMRRMQVLATTNNTLYKEFTGFIDSWTQRYTGPHSAAVDVQLTDPFKTIAVAQLPTSPYAKEVLADSPIHWWRLGDPVGTTVARDSVGLDHFTTFTGAPKFGTANLPLNDTDTGATFVDLVDGMQTAGGAPYFANAPLSVELLYSVGALVSGGARRYLVLHTTINSTGLAIYHINGTVTFAVATTDNNTGVSISAATPLVVGTTYHIAGTYDASGNAVLYINGVAVATGSTPATGITTGTAYTVIGQATLGGGAIACFAPSGVIDEVAMYNTALSATRIAAHSSAALTGWAGDSPGTRAGRILDAAGQLAVDRVISTGVSVLQAAKLGGQTALDHLQGVADAEFGKLFVNVHGAVVLQSRNDTVDQASQATFVDAHNGSVNLVQVATPEYTDQLIRNSITITKDGGVPQLVEDATSKKNYLLHSYSQSGLYHNSDDTSYSAAKYLVTRFKDPLQRIAQVTIKPREDSASLFPQALARELTDWITVTYTPQGLGSAFTQTTVIEGIQHDFSPKDWTTTWSLSPADTTAYWELGVTNFSELGTHTRIFF